jgi:predicted ABC-type ATPase
MTPPKQLWLLAGGNGAGKSTFYHQFLAPKGVKLVNADLIANIINPERPENVSYEAAKVAEIIMDKLLQQGDNFCFETVFSHPSKIDFVARAKALGYEVVLVYIHLNIPELNEARVQQRIAQGGHRVPVEKIYSRIPRTMQHIATTLPLVDEARLLDNSFYDDPFKQVAIVKRGQRVWQLNPLTDWAGQILRHIPGP